MSGLVLNYTLIRELVFIGIVEALRAVGYIGISAIAVFYTQNEVNKDSWLTDADGVRREKGARNRTHANAEYLWYYFPVKEKYDCERRAYHAEKQKIPK